MKLKIYSLALVAVVGFATLQLGHAGKGSYSAPSGGMGVCSSDPCEKITKVGKEEVKQRSTCGKKGNAGTAGTTHNPGVQCGTCTFLDGETWACGDATAGGKAEQ